VVDASGGRDDHARGDVVGVDVLFEVGPVFVLFELELREREVEKEKKEKEKE